MKSEGYSIKDLEVLSGIKAHTIRIWEKRYNLLCPERTDTNIRFYTDDDLRRMLNVSLLVKNGYKISKISTWKDSKIVDTVLSVTKSNNSENDFIEQLMLYMINFNNRAFSKLSDEIIQKHGIEDAFSVVFFNLFIRIGTYWQLGSIFPAQEHYVTNIFRQKIIAEIEKLEDTNSKQATMLFFLSENEFHEMSLLYYSYLAKKLGYNVVYLGQFVPFNDLVKLQAQLKIDYVFTAFINSISNEKLTGYLVDLRQLFQKQKIFITGLQIQEQNPILPRNVKVVKNSKYFTKYLA